MSKEEQRNVSIYVICTYMVIFRIRKVICSCYTIKLKLFPNIFDILLIECEMYLEHITVTWLYADTYTNVMKCLLYCIICT